MEAEADPRTANLYNNNMYSLAGRVAEALSGTGQSWEDLVTEHILKPLGMDHTTFYHYPREAHQHFATQYTYDDDGGLYRLDAETFKYVSAFQKHVLHQDENSHYSNRSSCTKTL